jgi:molybdopterin adenylyltransferase
MEEEMRAAVLAAVRVAVLTASTRSSRGEREDLSGPAMCDLVRGAGGTVSVYELLPDDRDAIASALRRICDGGEADIVFTLGGTGLAPSDVTPEATSAVIERTVPGISEVIRARSMEKTRTAMLSRGVAGVRNGTLIINMPGSVAAVRECFEIVRPVLDHAVELMRGRVKDCGRAGA